MPRISTREIERQRMMRSHAEEPKIEWDYANFAYTVVKGENRETHHAWDHLQLTKAERKGLSFEGQQALREKKYRERRAENARPSKKDTGVLQG